MNPVLILTHNNIALTQRCVESVLRQDIPTEVFIIDNGSMDGTADWAFDNGYLLRSYFDNHGVSAGWNVGLNHIFGAVDKSACLCIGNDTVLPIWAYSELLSYGEAFITGVAVDQMDQISQRPTKRSVSPHPDFSCFLISRDLWKRLGPFDERMKFYAQDCDLHVRAQKSGIPLWKSEVAYYHERSSTLRLASPEERCEIESQANKDRAVFRSIYNCSPGEPAYEAMFLNPVV